MTAEIGPTRETIIGGFEEPAVLGEFL
jgi:hypothetical protein